MLYYGPIEALLFNRKMEGIVDMLVNPPLTDDIASRAARQHRENQLRRSTAENRNGGRTKKTRHTEKDVYRRRSRRPLSLLGSSAAVTTSIVEREFGESLEEPERKVPRSHLSELPTEILFMVAARLNRCDAAAFGLTCQHFWQVVRGRFLREIGDLFGGWALQKLVFVGNSYGEGDYPAGLYSDDEIAEIGDLQVERMPSRGDGAEDEFWPTTLQTFVSDALSSAKSAPSIQRYMGRIETVFKSRRPRCRDAIAARLSRMPEFAYETHVPPDLKWRLVNSRTLEFVRAEGIAIKPEYIRGPHIEHIGFAEVLMVRTCWATPDHWYGRRQLPIPAKGRWAGHQFIILTDACLKQRREELKEMAPDKELQDVSEEVAVEMYGIWEAKFGADWREVISAPGFTPPSDYSD